MLPILSHLISFFLSLGSNHASLLPQIIKESLDVKKSNNTC